MNVLVAGLGKLGSHGATTCPNSGAEAPLSGSAEAEGVSDGR